MWEVDGWQGKHPLFYQEIKNFFEEELRKLKKYRGVIFKTAEKEHNGLAVREYYQTSAVMWYADRNTTAEKTGAKNMLTFTALHQHSEDQPAYAV